MRRPIAKLSHGEIQIIFLAAQNLADKFPINCGVWVSTAHGILRFHAQKGLNDQIGFASDYPCDVLLMMWNPLF